FAPAGNLSAVLVSVIDVKDLRRARSERVFDCSLAAIAALSPTGVIIEANRALHQLFGGRRGDVLGRPFSAFLQDPTHLETVLSRVRAAGHVDEVELHARRIDGEPIVVRARLADYIDSHQPPGSVLLSLLEVTDRKRLETHLAGVLRTEAIGKLAGGLAHDFNNLLTVVAGHSEVLLQLLDGDDAGRASAEAIQQASRRAAALTRQLLAFGRRQVFHLQVIDIVEFLDALAPTLGRVTDGCLDVRVDVGEFVPRIKIDPSQLEEVLVNLALNARDAAPNGGTLSIRVDRMEIAEQPPEERQWLRRGTYLRIDVTDSGPGLDEGARARVFEPFYTTQYLGRGIGLGLATVYGIVKQSEGYIWVDSEVGRGTTFTMLLPAWQDRAVLGASRPAANGAPQETILLVERDDGLRALLADVLRRHGYYVLDADSADRAFELCSVFAGRLALIVADVDHRDARGVNISDTLRAQMPAARVLHMSATDHSAPTASDGFLRKPFSLHVFAVTVRRMLDSASTALH
ncbi:MAG TPA: ATP-binding protein, partial [Vicinamibacterales bacterium]|nr:ATP-binding protein [Vicinamibacterales bacterium]